MLMALSELDADADANGVVNAAFASTATAAAAPALSRLRRISAHAASTASAGVRGCVLGQTHRPMRPRRSEWRVAQAEGNALDKLVRKRRRAAWRLINGPRVRRLKNAFEVMRWQTTQVVAVQSHLRRLLTRDVQAETRMQPLIQAAAAAAGSGRTGSEGAGVTTVAASSGTGTAVEDEWGELFGSSGKSGRSSSGSAGSTHAAEGGTRRRSAEPHGHGADALREGGRGIVTRLRHRDALHGPPVSIMASVAAPRAWAPSQIGGGLQTPAE